LPVTGNYLKNGYPHLVFCEEKLNEMLKCIIVDDEQFSIDALSKYITMMPGMEISGVFTDPVQALVSVNSPGQADALFMDIDMPGISGLELAKALRDKTEKLIFTTAHSKYAFEAYEVEGDAFLLKPYTFAKFSTTLNRLFAGKKSDRNAANHTDDYFLIKSKEDGLAIIKVSFDEVVAFESAQNYIKIHLVNNKVLIAYLTLKDIILLLKQRPGFMQLHRAFIIATSQISQIKGPTILMSNNLSFTVGDTYKPQLSEYLGERLMVTSRKNG
jgi:DNA-binding LytR/AlgR family response regulator